MIHHRLFLFACLLCTAGMANAQDAPTIRWNSKPLVEVRDPDGLRPDYDLRDDRDALDALRAIGLDNAQLELTVKRSKEDLWPSGITSSRSRKAAAANVKLMIFRYVAQWRDLALLVASAEDNVELPKGVKPDSDIFLVFPANAVAMPVGEVPSSQR